MRMMFCRWGIALVWAVHLVRAEAAPSRPNILYLYADDWGWGAIGPNGQAKRRAEGLPYVKTPHLDRLAAEGINFTRAYGCTVCSPARSSQQSGFHQGHTFADRNDPDNAKKAMRKEDVLIGEVLSQAGYATGYWGKWGYGGSRSREMPVIENRQTLPTAHGYHSVVAELHHVRAHTFFQPSLWSDQGSVQRKGGMGLIPNSIQRFLSMKGFPEQPVFQHHAEYPQVAYCDDVYAFSALEFVRRQAGEYRESGRPFIGILAIQVPHAPFAEIERLPEWDRDYRGLPFFESLPDQAKQWAAMVTRLDAHFGNLLQALDDPNGDGDHSDSIADETVVIFQSDNGGPNHAARSAFMANGGLRGQKGQIYEGGIRVPTLLRWPAKINADSSLQPGTRSDRVIDVTDWLPTFCELAGVDPPLGVDGVSMAPFLTQQGRQRSRAFVIHESGRGQSIIREPYKLIRARGGAELYDLEQDPVERLDLSSDKPGLVRELMGLLIGERVDEPKGFSISYHEFVGADGSRTSNPDAWSDYVYENAGIRYQEVTGPPQRSWVASMVNRSKTSQVARVNQDLRVLALELKGNPESKAVQQVDLGAGTELEGRNEIRIGAGGWLQMRGGRVSTLRWVEIQPGGRVSGHGMIAGDVYHRGRLMCLTSVEREVQRSIKVTGDLLMGNQAVTRIAIGQEAEAALQVSGLAELAGRVELIMRPDEALESGTEIRLLSAGQVKGRFGDSVEIMGSAAKRSARLRYSDQGVIAILL